MTAPGESVLWGRKDGTVNSVVTARRILASIAHEDSSLERRGVMCNHMWKAFCEDVLLLHQSLVEREQEMTFAAFRMANVTRCLRWHPGGIESWSHSDWLVALVGEVGELASLLKMRNRERDGLVGNKFSPTERQIADELADVQTYLDLLAESLGVDLAEAVARKFNEVSERNGFPDRIAVSAPAPQSEHDE